MEFRHATKDDIELILEMYEDGSKSLREAGINQWQGKDKPGEEELYKVLDEIYVLVDESAVSTARIIEYDNQYDKIYKGNWINNSDNYYAIHRVATLERKKRHGYAKSMFLEIEKLALKNNKKSIKIDTHCENIKMQNFLKSLDYKKCGEIILNNGDKRDAFEKIIKI